MTAVQHRNRQQVENSQINAHNGDEKHLIENPFGSLLASHLGN
jgi:hypothetical protein